jgi:PAS domain S-box-containing protein
MNQSKRLDDGSLLNILCKMENAVAVYSGQEIRIELANPAMLTAWGKGAEVIGRTLSEALPEIASQPFLQMLQQVWRTGTDDLGEGVPASLVVDRRPQLFYFDYAYQAIKNDKGEVYAILHTATDVTAKITNKQELERARDRAELLEREQALNEELSAANEELSATNEELHAVQDSLYALNSELERRVEERTVELSLSENHLRYLLSDAPIAIAVLTGRELVIEIANKKILEVWGKNEEIIGKRLYLALPELAGQDFLQLLDDVYTSGEPYYGYEVKAFLERHGKIEDVYVDFVFKPLKGTDELTSRIMITANVVTEQVIARQRVQQVNEELTSINEELNESQERLLITNLDLQSSENRLNKILSEVPVPVVVLMGTEQIITTTNDALLRFWDRQREEVLGKKILEVFPELNNQVYSAIWKHVLETGEQIKDPEKQVTYKDKVTGADRTFYIDYFCQPLEDRLGNRIGVLSTIIDVTEKVRSRKQIEEAEGRLRLAIDSAKLGTWYVDVVSRELKTSARLKEICGFYHTDEVTLEAATNQILEEYRADVVQAIDNAIANGTLYDVEFPVKGLRDGVIRWVRATGKLYDDGKGQGNFSGIVQDITQRKTEEQRKDDFLSIASHELKTPVTSLKGSLQLLNRHKTNLSHPSIPLLISQAYVSVEKLTDLIDDLLNTTKSNQGQLHLNYTEFTIAEMLEKCCHHIRVAGKYELVLQGDVSLKISADEMRIDQVVVNLVNNAVKYAPSERKIYLIVEDLSDKVKISVKDTGPGIPKDKVVHLFERYYRVDYSGAQYSGLGLGLYISAEIIKKHGGEIGVDTELGKGSTFWFTIPTVNSKPPKYVV